MSSHRIRALFSTALVSLTSSVWAQTTPLSACDSRKPDTEWLQKPAQTIEWACMQSVMTLHTLLPSGLPDFDPLKAQMAGDGITAAFAGGTLQGFRLWRPAGPPARPEDAMMDLTNASVAEQGHIGSAGELWWGRFQQGTPLCCRLNNRAPTELKVERPWWVVVGQETLQRRYKNMKEPSQLLRFMTGKVTPWSDVSEKGRLRFTLSSASLMRNVYGTGNNWLRQEKLTVHDASLELTLEKQLSGTLQVQVESARGKETIQLPVKRHVDEKPGDPDPRVTGLPNFRLIQAYANAQGQIQKCRYESDCFYANPDQPDKNPQNDPSYRMRGMFFGDDGQYLAIMLQAHLMQSGAGHPDTDRGNQPSVFGVLILQRAKL